MELFSIRIQRTFQLVSTQMLQGTDEQAIFNAFSGKLLFHGKEEFYEKCTSKR